MYILKNDYKKHLFLHGIVEGYSASTELDKRHKTFCKIKLKLKQFLSPNLSIKFVMTL